MLSVCVGGCAQCVCMYSLIHPQGAVESIALKTSKERTHLFEEISG